MGGRGASAGIGSESGCESGVSVCRFDLAVRWRRRFCDGIWWWMRAYEAQ